MMRLTAGLLLASLMLMALFRAVSYCVYVYIRVQIPFDAQYLESAMVHFAWRAQHGTSLYPDWEAYPHVANFYAPLSFLVTGQICRILATDIRGLYLVGRGVSVTSVVATTLLLGLVLKRRYGKLPALFGMALSLGGCPLFATGVMTRPDALAEFLGLTGFFLAAGRQRGTGIAAGLVLCLAAMTKQTTLVYPAAAAVGLYLEGRTRRAFLLIMGVTATLLITVVIVQWWLEPNFVRSLLGESRTPFRFRSWWNTVYDVAITDPEFLALLPAGIVLWTTGRKRELGLTALALITVTATLLSAAKYGSAPNYFLSVNSVAALAGGALWSKMTQRDSPLKPWHLATCLAVGAGLWTSASTGGAYLYLARINSLLATSQQLELYNRLYRAAENPKVHLLTDDGAIDIHQGERTVFADPYRFKLMVEEGQIEPSRVRSLIRAQSYEVIITTKDLFSEEYLTFDRGLPVPLVKEARLRYQPQGEFSGLFLYGRRAETSAH